MQSVTEIQLNKLRAHFRANDLGKLRSMYGEAGIITLARIKRENVHVVYSTVSP